MLQGAGIIKSVTNSKLEIMSDGKIRFSGDFKITLIKFIKLENHPLPKIKDMLATLGGLQYTKFDLNQTYIHLPVDEMSQPLLTFNVSKEFVHSLKPTKKSCWFLSCVIEPLSES